MLHKTRGIVFHHTDYSETSVVAKIYTELFGLQSYLVNSVRKKNAKVKQHVFQPLTLVEMVVYHKERSGLKRLADAKNSPVLKSIAFDIRKSSVILFMNEGKKHFSTTLQYTTLYVRTYIPCVFIHDRESVC